MVLNGRNGNKRWNEGLDTGAHRGVQRGPSSGSLLFLVWGIGDVGPGEPLIPLRVGGEPWANLGLAWGIRDPSWREVSSGRSAVGS